MPEIRRKPEWLKTEYSHEAAEKTRTLLEKLRLNTVCGSADCPNLGECFRKGTATFMIMGTACTRSCRFCKVPGGAPEALDSNEPLRVAQAVAAMKLSHAVVTSVTRDDLPDGGAAHFAETIREIRRVSPGTTVEVLIPDLQGVEASLDAVIAAAPDVLNHNLETVPQLYEKVRPEASYRRSLGVLAYCKGKATDMLTKTGIMVGLGETPEMVHALMDDALFAGCDILTIGQYLRPSKEHLEIVEYVTPEQFAKYREVALAKGFAFVASAPLVRSSYKAADALEAKRLDGHRHERDFAGVSDGANCAAPCEV